MNAVTARRIGDAACWITPFLLFWWCLPFASGTTLGNDYVLFGPQCQLELMLSWEAGAWPLYVPGWNGGQTASALSMGQLHHPLSHWASWMPGYWSGHALEWMTFWRLVTLGVAHWVWWRLLRRLGWRGDVAFVVTLAAVYHLRMLDCFRFGAPLEAYTGMLFLCAALSWLSLDPQRPERRAAVAAATYWLVTCGHPPFGLYAAGAAAVWAVAWPFVLRHADPAAGQAVTVRRQWLVAGACMGAGIAVSAWFLLPYYAEFVRGAAQRAGDSYAWSLDYSDTAPGVLAAFGLPLRTDAGGAFGGSVLTALPLTAPLLLLGRRRWHPAVWLASAAALFTVCYAMGAATPVHRLAWEWIPFLDRMRVPGRITIVWPVCLLLLATAVHAAPAVVWQRGTRRLELPPLLVCTAGAAGLALLSVVIWYAAGGAPTRFAPVLLRGAPAAAEWVAFVAGLGAAAALVARLWWPERARFAGAGAAAGVGLQLAIALYWGTWTAPRTPTPPLEAMQHRRAASWDYPHLSGEHGSDRVVVRQFTEGILEPRLAWATTDARFVPDAAAAFAQLARDRRPNQVVLTGPGPATPAPASDGPCRVALTRAGYNQLRFDVELPGAGWLVTNLPFTGRWRAAAGGQALPVQPADGFGTAVALPAGRSTVDLYYVSTAAIVGVVASALALALFGVVLSLRIDALRVRAAVAGSCALFALLAPTYWYGSLYAADLGYRFTWRTPPPAARRNLAYGKRVTLDRPFLSREPYLHYGGRAVDGEPGGRAAVAEHPGAAPTLEVDLAGVTPLGALEVHGAEGLPFTVQVSDDRINWRRAGAVEPGASGEAVAFAFPPATAGRFVRLKRRGPGRLAVAELKVFPP